MSTPDRPGATRPMSRIRFALGLGVLAEIAVWILVASQIGIGWTILLTLATSALGWMLLAREGTRTLRELQERARDRRPAGDVLGNAGLIAAGGLLMVLPGFIGDLLGLLCLIPGTRTVARKLLTRLFAARVLSRLPDRARGPVRVTSTRTTEVGGAGSGSHVYRTQTTPEPPVIEGEIVR